MKIQVGHILINNETNTNFEVTSLIGDKFVLRKISLAFVNRGLFNTLKFEKRESIVVNVLDIDSLYRHMDIISFNDEVISLEIRDDLMKDRFKG